jgi:hypothetical protein
MEPVQETTPVLPQLSKSYRTAGSNDARTSLIYAVTIFLSAFLLFQVQLLMGKYLLPFFGGAPAVWNTCMLIFQVLLLAGYGYAHWVSIRLSPAAQSRLHLLLLGSSAVLLVVLGTIWRSPITPGVGWKPAYGGNPVLQILGLLTVTIAFPFFLLSATGPLLQDWFARIHGRSPYRLYALSNAGSLLGLLTYPFLLERVLTVPHQAWLWSVAYGLFAGLCGAIALSLRGLAKQRGLATKSLPKIAGPVEVTRPHWSQCLFWMALPACSSAMLLAATNLMCQDVAVVPLLWVLPLALYLLSFIICFEQDRWYQRGLFHPLYFVMVALALNAALAGPDAKLLTQISLFSLALFAVCMVCHGELARLKPPSPHLTSFYLMIATGGALGGVFVVLIAPQIFHQFWEFHLALIGCGVLLFFVLFLDSRSWLHRGPSWLAMLFFLGVLLVPELLPYMAPSPIWFIPVHNKYSMLLAIVAVWALISVFVKRTPRAGRQFRWSQPLMLGTLGALGILSYTHTTVDARSVQLQVRNFFGVKTVFDSQLTIWLKSGNIKHGEQMKAPSLRATPTTYYAPDSGVGLLLRNYPRGNLSSGTRNLRVGVIGLGAGTVAAYGKRGDYFRFYEIDPAVVELSVARDPTFTFLKLSEAKVDTVVGDGRLAMEREASQGEYQKFDILVEDAFSSDSIPVHLLTSEAMRLYLQHLSGPDAVLAFHITNRFLDLRPVLAGLSQQYRLSAVEVHTRESRWVLISRNPRMLNLPALAAVGRPLEADGPPLLWMDDYSNLFQVLR